MTNPDNVGGLPELPGFVAIYEALERLRGVLCTPEGFCVIVGSDADRQVVNESLDAIEVFADQMRAYAELCRAAPAGSGEVEEYDWDAAHEALESIDDYARMDVGVAPHGPYTVLRDLLTKAKGWQEAAALLRKLQQGADHG